MTSGKPWLWIGVALGVLMLLSMDNIKKILLGFLPPLEGFSPAPYWDHKQWSWGYGTRVPGSVADPARRPSGTISRHQAALDAWTHAEHDLTKLKPLVKLPLKANQWAALLSFAYNLGRGHAAKLVPFINSQDWPGLKDKMREFIFASGQPNNFLRQRREKEIELFFS